jgi:polo-like kinase 1
MSEDVIEEEVGKSDGNKVIRRYTRGRLLGKGGFARCYEITNI